MTRLESSVSLQAPEVAREIALKGQRLAREIALKGQRLSIFFIANVGKDDHMPYLLPVWAILIGSISAPLPVMLLNICMYLNYLCIQGTQFLSLHLTPRKMRRLAH